MRKACLVLFALLLSHAQGLLAQTTPDSIYSYGNQWYQFNQNYFKLLVLEDGFYRVSRQDLENANVNLNGMDPDRIQIIYRGQEIPVNVVKNGNDLDYLEFYGRRNDGWVDSLMYKNPKTHRHDGGQQANRFYSIYSDTAAYFVTWDGGQGSRFTPFFQSDYNNYSPEPWFRYRSLTLYTNRFFLGGGGSEDAEHVLNSDWTTGEGYVGNSFGNGAVYNWNVQTPGYANSGNPNTFSARVIGISSYNHILNVDLDGVLSYADTNSGVQIKTHTWDQNVALKAITRVRYKGLGSVAGRPDQQVICWFSADYDRIFDMENASSMDVTAWNNANTSYFRVLNADVNSQAWIYDFTNKTRIDGTVSGDTLHFLVPGASNPRTLLIVTDNGLKSPMIQPYTHLTNLSDPANGAEMVLITHRSLASSALKYKAYRDTSSANPLNTRVVYTDEIYDEFGYGSFTPWALKMFCKYAMDNWQTRPRYFFLWGKGTYLKRNISVNLVPVFGQPANDYEYVSNFRPTEPIVVPDAAIGRVNIYDNEEGEVYLRKIDEYEHQDYRSWMKEAILLGGGKNFGEQAAIYDGLVDTYYPKIIAEPAAGEAHYIQKWNTGTRTNTDQTIEEVINDGVGIIHFFGHSSTNIFDVDILEPNQYSNYNKYPFMLAFGCYGGDFTNLTKSFGEKFITEPDRGAIGYLANSTAGFLSQLKDYGRQWYDNAYGDLYGAPIGDVNKAAIRDYVMINGVHTQFIFLLNHAKQINLQGDPAVALRLPVRPDLEITNSDVFLSPENLSAQEPEYGVNVVVRNLGMLSQDSFLVTVRQRTPGGQLVEFPPVASGPIGLIDTLYLETRNDLGPAIAGVNDFEVYVDALDSLDEYLEDNNIVNHKQLIEGNAPAILFPYEYAVVGEEQVSLTASSYVMTQQSGLQYIFEIDTVFNFSSPALLNSGPVSGSASLVEWQVPRNLSPNQVYFWRVRLANVNPANWANSSFKYIPGKTGWSQSRPPQFLKNESVDVSIDELRQEWNFDPLKFNLHAFIWGSGVTDGKPEFFLGPFSSNSLDPPEGIVYTRFDAKSLQSHIVDLTFGDWLFVKTPEAVDDLVGRINTARLGDYILIMSSQNPRVNLWDTTMLRALEQIGCDYNQLRNVQDGDRIIILGKKGDSPGKAKMILKPNLPLQGGGMQHDLKIDLLSSKQSGEIFSTQIGPSDNWGELLSDWSSLDPFTHEDLKITVLGVTASKVEVPLVSDLAGGTHQLDTIDPRQYKFIKLRANLNDNIYLTPPQLDDWTVFYESAPDLVLDPNVDFAFSGDTLEEGQIARIKMTTRNVSLAPADSFRVRFSVERDNRSRRYLGEQMLPPLTGKSTQTFEFTFNTALKNLEGDLSLIVEVNPDQAFQEQYYFNNTYVHSFHLNTDNTNPILDVTFDGKHLMDNDDIVSPDPEIAIMLNDENAFLPVPASDSTFKIWFGKGRSLSLLSPVTISGNNKITPVAGRLPQNKAKLFFKPGILEDGEYTLRVQAYDFKGNESGDEDYVIHFNVINEKSITQILPYPNPFSTNVRWAYTLTGSDKPYVFEIRIYTISGRLVKRIDLVELDDVEFGNNLSRTTWDGTDEFGDKLANGVYLYKAVVKFRDRYNASERDVGIDRYFNNGYGKLYILR